MSSPVTSAGPVAVDENQAPPRRSYAERYRLLRSKWNEEWWSVAFGGPVGNVINAVIADVRWVTPNGLTIVGFLCKVAVCLLLVLGGPDLATIALLQAAVVLDCMDGSLARYRKTPSPMGAFLDKVTDAIGVVLMFGGVGWRIYLDTGDAVGLVIAFGIAASLLIRGYVYWVVASMEPATSSDKRIDFGAWTVGQRAVHYLRSMPRIVAFAESDLYFWIGLALALGELRRVTYGLAIATGLWFIAILGARFRTVLRVESETRMNDAKTAIVLAAGSSRRMGDLTRDQPKSLLAYKDGTILGRLLAQIATTSIEHIVIVVGYQRASMVAALAPLQARPSPRITIVENDRFADDTNIHSMRLALREVTGSVVIFEADTIMEDAMVTYVAGTDFEHVSAWFTRGAFNPSMYGGIVQSDPEGRIVDVRVVPRWEPGYADYRKMTGLMRISAAELPVFRDLVERYAEQSIAQYFFVPWAEHIAQLPSIEGDASHYRFRTFNTPDEYRDVISIDFDPPPPRSEQIEMIAPGQLKHIEGYDEQRVLALADKIRAENLWTKPLYVEKTHGLVLDGQHRLQVALRMGLARVPVQRFDYHDVAVWSLRKPEAVDVATVIRRANAGDVYPYKTVKHKFPNVIDACAIPLADLTDAGGS